MNFGGGGKLEWEEVDARIKDQESRQWLSHLILGKNHHGNQKVSILKYPPSPLPPSPPDSDSGRGGDKLLKIDILKEAICQLPDSHGM